MKLVIAESAWASLNHLQKYWAQYNTDERVHERVDELLEEAEWLSAWPGAGAQEVYMVHGGMHYCKWAVGRVKIIYYIVDDELRICDFFDAR